MIFGDLELKENNAVSAGWLFCDKAERHAAVV